MIMIVRFNATVQLRLRRLLCGGDKVSPRFAFRHWRSQSRLEPFAYGLRTALDGWLDRFVGLTRDG
jgi:hypothetical protein